MNSSAIACSRLKVRLPQYHRGACHGPASNAAIQLLGYRLAGHHFAAHGTGDDDGRRELGATCRPDGQSHPDLGLPRCEPPSQLLPRAATADGQKD